MQIELTRKFQKQVENCNDKHIRSKILAIIQAVIATENLNELPNLKKLTGYKNFYRIRNCLNLDFLLPVGHKYQ
jgi:hypothetical protein